MAEVKALEQKAKLAESASKSAEPEKASEDKAKASESEETVSEKKTPEDIAAEAKAAVDDQIATDAVEAYLKSPEYEKALQSAKDKSITQETAPLRNRIAELEKSDAEKELAANEAKESKQWEADGVPAETIKNFQAERRGQIKAARELTDSINEHVGALDKLHAWELSQKFGVDIKELLKCKTPEEMDTRAEQLLGKAKDDEIVSLKADKKAAEEKPAKSQQIDGDTAGTGADLSTLTPAETVKRHLDKLRKKQ